MSTGWWRLPDAPLRAPVALAAGAGLLATDVMSRAAAAWLGAGGASRAMADGVFAGAMILAAGAAGASHPHPRFGAANAVTTSRLVLVSLLAGLVMAPAGSRTLWTAVALTAVAAALDGVDGWLARRGRLASAFGARFDMETDALLVLVLSVLVWWFGKAGPWVLACGFMRYGFVAAGAVLPWMRGPLSPTVRGKTVAVAQFIGLATALSPPFDPPASSAVAAVTLAALAWSFAIDVRRLRMGRNTG